jgi:hypothetical protein
MVAYFGGDVLPTIHWFANCKIAIYADDHFPPHFHLLGRGWRCAINIETLRMMAGSAAKHDLREALEWAVANREFLVTKWSEFNERD